MKKYTSRAKPTPKTTKKNGHISMSHFSHFGVTLPDLEAECRHVIITRIGIYRCPKGWYLDISI